MSKELDNLEQLLGQLIDEHRKLLARMVALAMRVERAEGRLDKITKAVKS